MPLHKLRAFSAACWIFAVSAFGDTLTFVAQPASIGGDDDWFNAVNWFLSDGAGNLVPAGRVPLANETAIITGTVDLQASGVRVQTLVATNNSVITNGTMAVETLQLLSSSSINGAVVNVLNGLTVGGTNCVISATTLSIAPIASGTLQPVSPATESSLVLTQAAILEIGGVLSLKDRTQVIGGGLPQCRLVILQGGFLLSTNTAGVRGAAAGHLIFENNGTVIAYGGSLNFSDGIDWKSSFGLEEFRAAGLDATILFSSPFHVESGVTSLFTGGGTNRWLSGASLDGVVQVGAMDLDSQLSGPGHLEILDSVSGSGWVHILGTTNQGGLVSWGKGLLALPGITVDPGASLLIGGASGAGCQLSGSVITNMGSCTFWGGNLDFSEGAIFNNESNAVFVIASDGSFSSSAAGGAFNNAGTFQKVSAGITQFGVTNSIDGPDFNNTGLLDVRAGQLNLFGGIGSGEFRASAPDAEILYMGPYQLKSGATNIFTGSGTNRWLGNVVVEGTAQVGGRVPGSAGQRTGNLEIACPVSGQGSVHVLGGLAEAGRLSWSSGSASLARIDVDAGATLQISGAPNLERQLSGCTLNNSGACKLQGADLVLAHGAVVNNLVGATFLLQTNVSLKLAPSDGPATFNNAGSLLNSVANGTNTVGADLNNSGRLEVLGGILACQGALQQTQGTTAIDSATTLRGTNFNLLGGTVTGSGTIDANLINTGGTVSPGATVGTISTGVGKGYQQGVAGNLLVEIGGSNPAAAYDHLVVAGNAILDGQLQLSFVNGFVPQPGQAFQVLNCSSLAGRFGNISTPPLAGALWVSRYSGSGVSLVLASNVALAQPYVSGGELNLPVSTTPGLLYLVQMTDDLDPTNWQTVSTVTGDGTVKTIQLPMTQAHGFYRVLLQ